MLRQLLGTFAAQRCKAPVCGTVAFERTSVASEQRQASVPSYVAAPYPHCILGIKYCPSV